jgi:signal transduction histidine kinase
MAAPRRPEVTIAIAAAAALGVAAEWVGFGWTDARHWIPDLATGWTIVACGLVAGARRPRSRTGALLTAAGVAWFAGNFASARWEPLAWTAGHLAFVHRGVLAHALLSYPTGRLRSRALVAAVAAGYVVSLVPQVTESDRATVAVGLAVIAVAVATPLPARGPAVLFGAVLAGGAAIRLATPADAADEAALLAYQAGICVVAVDLVARLRSRRREEAAVADLVVELGEHRSGTLRDALAHALGDPTLEVVYWGEDGAPLDAAGRAVAAPEPGPDRAVTVVERGGERVAALVHDPAVLDDPALLDAVAGAARLEAANSRLQADVRARVAELDASRRRLLEAGDEERSRLERRLHDGAERRLDVLSAMLREASAGSDGDAAREAVERARRQLERTRADLHELAHGLHPRVLSEQGLAGGLRDLAAASPVEVDVAAEDVALSPAARVTAYFVCAEALANVVKHAGARRARIAVRRNEGRLLVEVEDDGVGGADPDAGSGLRGLADRIEALGGALRVESPPGRGTLLAAEIPLGGEEA